MTRIPDALRAPLMSIGPIGIGMPERFHRASPAGTAPVHPLPAERPAEGV